MFTEQILSGIYRKWLNTLVFLKTCQSTRDSVLRKISEKGFSYKSSFEILSRYNDRRPIDRNILIWIICI